MINKLLYLSARYWPEFVGFLLGLGLIAALERHR